MRWHPIMKGAAATGYVGAVVLLFQLFQSLWHDTPDTLLQPMVMLSLLVFSVAVMAFLFFYQPAVLMLEGKREEATTYFLKTLGAFGAFALIAVLVVALLGGR